MRKSKWVIEIIIYCCGHKSEVERNGLKSKWADSPVFETRKNELCPSCYYKMLEEG